MKAICCSVNVDGVRMVLAGVTKEHVSEDDIMFTNV